ncbi:hypothetical protein [Pseudarthrobacter sp. fls2-241-R2A-127]|uniref:hypothetical protein n=1 Tax=Pseudarthrobacter sp. fls2-241-R2A-127 TaxID=3040303 RepID=UPI002557C738|nr:hypothetical protein [Pseudarthrobacter sp. fls2-241-R2A-127]
MNSNHGSKASMALGWRMAAAPVAVLGAGLIAFARLSPTAQGTIWAEDGAVFVQDALARPGILGVFSPYQGYLHVVPRLAAAFVVRLFPVDAYAVAISLLSSLIVGLVAFMVFLCASAISTRLVPRLAWASITILVAPAALETSGNLANLHWYLLWLAPWLLIKPARNGAEGIVLFVVAALASLTEILTLMFVPLFLYQFRERKLWPARAGLLIGIACQVFTTVSYPRSAPFEPANFLSVVAGWFLNSSSAVMFGTSNQIALLILNFGALPIVLAALPFFAAFLFLLFRSTAAHRFVALVAVAASVGVWAAAVLFNFSKEFNYAEFQAAQWHEFLLGRYSVLPSMFLLAILPLLAVALEETSAKAATSVLAVFALLQCLYFFPSFSFRQDGPIWAVGVADARAACAENPEMAAHAVATAPGNWKVDVPCAILRR